MKYKTKRERPLVLCTSLIILFFLQKFYENNGDLGIVLVFTACVYLILRFLNLNKTQIFYSILILSVFFYSERDTNYEEINLSRVYWSEEMLIVLLEHTNDFKIIDKNIYKLYKNHINYTKYQDAHFL